jgi:hypothetical protein
MALSAHGNIGTQKFTDVDLDNAVKEIIASGAPKLFGIEIDNSQNAEDSYVKLWDAASPTVGTTAPIFIFRVPAGKKVPFPIYADGAGWTSAVGIWLACVTTGGTAGTTSPTNNVTATLWTD